MLIPLMFWPDGWDSPISLAKTTGHTSKHDVETIDWPQYLAMFINLWNETTDHHTGGQFRLNDKEADFFLLYDNSLPGLNLSDQYVLQTGGKKISCSTYEIPDMEQELLKWQDDPRPVFLLAGNDVLDDIRFICRFWLIKGKDAMQEKSREILFQAGGFLPDPARSDYSLKLLAESEFLLFGRKDPRELVEERIQLGAFDLHLHTTASDSSDSPDKVCQRVIANGLKTFAVTDHDNMTAIGQVGKCLQSSGNEGKNIYFIPGVEMSVQQEREIHLLAYFPLGGYEKIEPFLREQQKSRELRNLNMISTLQSLGYDITLDDLNSSGDHSVGRMQTALLLKARGYVKSTKQAFDEILGEGRPGYIERPRPPMKEAIWQIRKAGGLPVIAHPALYGWCRSASEDHIPEILLERLGRFKEWGMLGVECFHGEASPETQQTIAKAAIRLGLLITGGSDDHGSNKLNTHMYNSDRKFSLPTNPDPEIE